MKRFWALLWLLTGAWSSVFAQDDALRIHAVISQDKLVPGGSFRVAVIVELAAPWHVNANPASLPEFLPTTVTFEPAEGVSLGRPEYPRGERVQVSWADAPVALYSGKIVIFASGTVHPDARGSVTLEGSLRYQACDDNVCYAPATVPFTVSADIGPTAKPQHLEIFQSAVPLAQAPPPEENSIATMLRERGLAVTLIVLFVSGLLLNFTPCVYPMIAITVSYFGGQTEGRTTSAALIRAVAYWAGIVITYSVLGLVAALTGGLFGALLQSPWVLAGIGGLLVAMALSMFGLYELRPPPGIVQKAAGLSATAGLIGVFLLGATVGIIAAPCLAPVVVVVLAFAGSSGDPWVGWWLFFALGAGLGAPYVVLGTFSGLLTKLPRAGVWMVKVKIVFGILLLAVAAWITHPLWWPRPATADVSPERIRQQLAAARAAGQPVLMDFYADWCAPCKEMDKFTFPDPRVQERLKAFVLVKVDLTKQTSPAARQLMEKYTVRGVPTYVFLDANGKERADCRQIGFLPADEFVKLLDRALQPAPASLPAPAAGLEVPPQLLHPF